MISIIIPAYNAALFIEKTLESVIQQTYTNWELIVINDGSKDTTENILRMYESEKIKVISQVNKGVSSARNAGIKLAKGEMIAFLDADDYWLPENLQLKYNLLINSKADFVFSNFFIGDNNLTILKKGGEGTDHNILKNLLLWEKDVIPGASSNLMIKKSCFDAGLEFDEQFSTAADQDFCLYLSNKFIGKHLNEYTWVYRVYNESMSKNVVTLTKDHTGVYKKASANKLFRNFFHEQKSFSNMYLILAGCWWVNGNNKFKSFQYIVLSLLCNPFNLRKLIAKKIKPY